MLGDVVVVGALVSDNLRVDAPSGVVRAFDARTGALRWAWDPVPPGFAQRARAPGEPLYTAGTPNVWSILSGDAERGLVFVPTGNPSPDLFDAIRQGLDYYGSSVVALKPTPAQVAGTSRPCTTTSGTTTCPRSRRCSSSTASGGGRPAVAQITKMGHLFLLDRETGEPLYPVEERPVAAGRRAGETLSPTQPFPTHPGAARADRRDPTRRGASRRSTARTAASSSRSCATTGSSRRRRARRLDRLSRAPRAARTGAASRSTRDERHRLRELDARADGGAAVPREEFDAARLRRRVQYPTELYPMAGAPYGVQRGPLLSRFGAPCIPPPWGTLAGRRSGDRQDAVGVTLGTTRDQAPFPLWFDLGAPNLGGSLATAGGLVFIGATTDKFLRAFDAKNGEEIWRFRTPYTANATPITFRLRKNGKQFVVIAAGGHGWSRAGRRVDGVCASERERLSVSGGPAAR